MDHHCGSNDGGHTFDLPEARNSLTKNSLCRRRFTIWSQQPVIRISCDTQRPDPGRPRGRPESCPEVIELCIEIGRIGLQASLSDAGVGAQMGRAAAAGTYQNVCINLAGLADASRRAALMQRADVAWERARKLHAEAEEAILVKLRQSVAAES
jgi:hypothetical protein